MRAAGDALPAHELGGHMSVIVKSPGVTEQVTEYLQKQIADGVWEPGEKISSENELTKVLGVSRASIRSGIRELVAVGVLDTHQGKGTFVKAIPASDISKGLGRLYKANKDMHDLLEYRMIIETECCRQAAERISEEELARLQAYYEAIKAEYAKPERDDHFFSDNDFGFHKVIYESTGNRLIIDSMNRITDEAQRYQRLMNADYFLERAVHYHKKILDALKARNGDKASKAMREHLKVVVEGYDRMAAEGKP